MQYKNKAKHINIRDGILLLAKKIRPNIEREKKSFITWQQDYLLKSCSNLLDRNIKTISTQKRSAYKKMDITTDVELIHLMLNEFYISVDIT